MPTIQTVRVLVSDDDLLVQSQVRELLELANVWPDTAFEVVGESTLVSTVSRLERERFDLLLLDIRTGEASEENLDGLNVLTEIKAKAFIPIIFYSGVPQYAEELASVPLIQIVPKEDTDGLIEAVKLTFTSSLIPVHRAISAHVEDITRQYMWDFASKHLSAFFDNAKDQLELSHVLARRLATSLTGNAIYGLAAAMGSAKPEKSSEGLVHAAEMYIYPPIEGQFFTGDVIYSRDEQHYLVVLTPSCDLVVRADGTCKAEYVLIASCEKLSDTAEFKSWTAVKSKKETDSLLRIFSNRRSGQDDRYFFLPGVFDLPDLLADLQQVRTIPIKTLREGHVRKATLDSPFGEALLNRFTRYAGRVGTPDLDSDIVLSRIGAVN